MSQASSVSARRVYGLARVCRMWPVPRSTVYARRADNATAKTEASVRTRPRGPCSDDELLLKIRAVLAEPEWIGEGYRKVWARLRHRETRTSQRRVLRLMRSAGLLAPTPRRPRGPKAHDRSITPERPDRLWGTDATSVLTAEGQATIFFVIDHCTAECLGIHAALRGTRFDALEPLRQAVRYRFARFDAAVASPGLALRHDHGSQFVSRAFQDELRWLGIKSSPAFVREPQGNGCAERFVRTLKEQLLWLQTFNTVEELRLALLAFKERYNSRWLIARHGYRSPAEQQRLLSNNATAA